MTITTMRDINMTDIPYYHVDAFADRAFTGNQAAVMLLDNWLPDDVLQSIGEENNFAETAFIIPDATDDADYELRWFTPTNEVPLCGHATLASGHIVLSLNPNMQIVRFRTRKAGILSVQRDDDGHSGDGYRGDGYSMALPAYPPEPAEMPDWIAMIGGTPIERQLYPERYNLLRFESVAEVMALSPDFKGLAKLGVDDQYICTALGAGHVSGADVVSRVFVPGCGVDEDSVTGSAHAVLTPYWAKQLGRDSFSAYQASARGGHVACRMDGDHVWLGGKCVTVVEGAFRIGA
jgi:PhzF family phenazine biosynthesis protein